MEKSNTTSIIGKQKSWLINHWQTTLKISISLGLVGLVLYLVDVREIDTIVLNTEPWYLLAALGLICLDRALMAYKWNLLLRAVEVRIPFFSLFRTYTVSVLSGMLLPSNLGGDLFRLYSLSRHQVDTKAVLASMIVERVIAFVAMLVLTMFSLGLASYLMRESWSLFSGIWLVIGAGGLIAVGLIVLANGTFKKWIDKLAARYSQYKLADKLHHIYTLSSEYRNHRRTVAIVSVWTLVEQLAPVAGVFLLVRALHLDVSLLELAAIIPIIMLAVRLPISFDGYGIAEGLYVALFGLVGVSASEAFLLSTVSRILPLLFALPWGIHFIMLKGRQPSLPQQEITRVEP